MEDELVFLPQELWKIEPELADGEPTGRVVVCFWAKNNTRYFVLVDPAVD
jgi:hypothetical protein